MLADLRKRSTAFRIRAVKKVSIGLQQSSGGLSGSVLDQDPDEIGADMIRHRPSSLKHLATTSGFSEQQLKILYRGFKQVSKPFFEFLLNQIKFFQECPNGYLTENRLKGVLTQLFPFGGLSFCSK